MSDKGGKRAVDQEVYSVETTVPTHYEIETQYTLVGVEDVDSVWRVDEIYDGRVRLTSETRIPGPDPSVLGNFDPESARKLGKALQKAADYAERQQEVMDGE